MTGRQQIVTVPALHPHRRNPRKPLYKSMLPVRSTGGVFLQYIPGLLQKRKMQQSLLFTMCWAGIQDAGYQWLFPKQIARTGPGMATHLKLSWIFVVTLRKERSPGLQRQQPAIHISINMCSGAVQT